MFFMVNENFYQTGFPYMTYDVSKEIHLSRKDSKEIFVNRFDLRQLIVCVKLNCFMEIFFCKRMLCFCTFVNETFLWKEKFLCKKWRSLNEINLEINIISVFQLKIHSKLVFHHSTDRKWISNSFKIKIKLNLSSFESDLLYWKRKIKCKV